MKTKKIIILADDLTGANDTAIQFVKHGMSALVVNHNWLSGSFDFHGHHTISIDTDSRQMNGKEAYNVTRNLVRQLGTIEPEGLYYKKIDSVLRGNPGSELSALMDELDIPLAIVAPSFPANHSTVEQGILKSGMSFSQTSIDAVKVFANNMDRKVAGIPLEKIREGHAKTAEFILTHQKDGAEVFVADSVIDEDLAIISRIPAEIKTPLVLAGSGALADQMARNLSSGKKVNIKPVFSASKKPVLVISGTRQGETAVQFTSLSEKTSVPIVGFNLDMIEKGESEKAILLAFEEASKSLKKNPGLCIVAVESMLSSEIKTGHVVWGKTDDDLSHAISAAIGKLVVKLTNTFNFPVIFSTGGDTTLEICRSLSVRGIEPLAEILPGIPVGKIMGEKHENRYLISKSGRFGDKDTLIKIKEYLEEL